METAEKTTKKIEKPVEIKKAAKPVVKATAKPAAQATEFAVIETGGKQYEVSVGGEIRIEKLLGDHKEGETIVFDKVLLVDNGTDTTIGTPHIAGAKVSATLIKIGRAKKVVVIHYKQKSNYFKKNGHRQPFFQMKIESIK